MCAGEVKDGYYPPCDDIPAEPVCGLQAEAGPPGPGPSPSLPSRYSTPSPPPTPATTTIHVLTRVSSKTYKKKLFKLRNIFLKAWTNPFNL